MQWQIITWLLPALVCCSLDTIPFTYSDPPLTEGVTVTHTLSVYTGSHNYICIYYSPHLTGPDYTYIQASYNATATHTTSYSNMNYIYFDPDGFAMLKNQLIVLPRDTSQSNLSIQIFIANATQDINLPYDLVINTSLTAPCPANCNGHGTCSPNGVCQCDGSYLAYDCSVMPQVLSSGKNITVEAVALSFTYVKIPQSDLSASSSSTMQTQTTLQIDLNTVEGCTIQIYMKQHSAGGVLVNPYSYSKYQKVNRDSTGYNTVLGEISGDYYLLFVNNGQKNCEIICNLSQDTSMGVLLVVIIVIGVGILAAIVFGIIFIIKKRRQQGMVGTVHPQSRPQNANSLSNEEIERYFPVLEASKLGVQSFKEQSIESYDCLPMKDCVVCLCQIEPKDQVRLTYCNHLFHKDCLTGWFAKTQNCPYCRENFDKPHTKKLYETVLRNFSRKSSAPYQQLRGDTLALQVSNYQRSKGLLVQQIRSTEDSKINSTVFSIDDFQ